MSESKKLLLRESHFAFGENWARYAGGVAQAHIEEATQALRRLVGENLTGKRFLDIGCGSGIHALAAMRLGASAVLAVDIDADSVATAVRMLEKHAPNTRWRVSEISVFDLNPATVGQFDVVYSWGVLHHTGDLRGALRCASKLVDGDGLFAFALYQKTLCCPLWKLEKSWYAHAGVRAQNRARRLYTGLYRLDFMLRGRRFEESVSNWKQGRGMDFQSDVHDWLGGWPYESISRDEVERLLGSWGFERQRVFGPQRMTFGVLGAGCNEYVYARSRRG